MIYKNNFRISKRSLYLSSFFAVVFFLLVFSFSDIVFASETEGTIDTTDKYAWGENVGWINFGCTNCSVAITDTVITGYAWSEEYGWINLNPTNSGVTNTSAGVLGGYAWGSNIGWIDFTGVTINSSGEFLGYATVDSNSSQISFNCVNGSSCSSSDFKVSTDWRPTTARTVVSSGGSSSSGGSLLPCYLFSNCIVSIPPATILDSANKVTAGVSNTINSLYNSFLSFLNPRSVPAIVEVPKIAPIAFSAQWNLLPVNAINTFVFAPLPYEIRVLATKFPELGETLKDVGVERFTDIRKLVGTTFNIQGLAELDRTLKNLDIDQLTELKGISLNVPGIYDTTGKLSLIKGLPVSQFPLIAKKSLPTEFVFARGGKELIDLNVNISINESGGVTQKISSLPGETLRLVVKPISSARSVTGYFVFKSATPRISKTEISRSSLSASALLAFGGLIETNPKPISPENKLVLSSFEYTDPDRDGIYTADVVTPVVPGEYEVITVIDYIDPVLGTRQIRMVTVIDPEGYVFEKNGNKETRIPNATVSLYYLNSITEKYELWPAKNYYQDNPQITDVRGTYSFLVPEGSYYFGVEAPDYKPFKGEVFTVKEGSGIHRNIELTPSRGWLPIFDWSHVFLLGVLLLLVYNLYHKTLQEKLLKSFNQDGK